MAEDVGQRDIGGIAAVRDEDTPDLRGVVARAPARVLAMVMCQCLGATKSLREPPHAEHRNTSRPGWPPMGAISATVSIGWRHLLHTVPLKKVSRRPFPLQMLFL
jgi:hypothetical protein